jgi:hypothetical protein
MAPGRLLVPVGVERDRLDDEADSGLLAGLDQLSPERATMHLDAGRAASSPTGCAAVIDPS